jgi:hypothetical protein
VKEALKETHVFPFLLFNPDPLDKIFAWENKNISNGLKK